MNLQTDVFNALTDCALVDNEPVAVMSPYITGKTLRSFLKNRGPAKIYTLFHPELFASNSSDLKTLKGLLTDQHEIYQVAQLHAKVIVVGNRMATLGSQNFTTNGQRNKELSISTEQRTKITAIKKQIDQWQVGATPVTKERIKAMEAAVVSLKAKYQDYKKACADVADAFEKTDNAQSGKDDISSVIVKSIAKLRSSAPLSAQVKVVNFNDEGKAKLSLYPPKDQSFLEWKIDSEPYSLEPKQRYFCVLDSQKLGWARINKTRITFVADDVVLDFEEFPLRPDWKIHVSAKPKARQHKNGQSNLMLNIYDSKGRGLCCVYMRFDFDSAHSFAPVAFTGDNRGAQKATAKEQAQSKAWIRKHQDQFDKEIINVITTPFTFEKAYTGKRGEFFGKPQSVNTVELKLYHDQPFLAVSAVGKRQKS